MREILNLEPDGFVAHGGGRQVFLHPENPDAIIKVQRKRGKALLRHRVLRPKFVRPSKRRFGSLRVTYKEYEEYLAASSRLGHLPIFIPRFLGFVDTSLGIGVVYEKITDSDGNLAPNLRQYIEKNGVSAQLTQLVENLIAELEKAHIVAPDLSVKNIVVGGEPEGAEMTVSLVDGISENSLIRLKTWSPFVFRRWLAQKRRSLLASMHEIDTGRA